MDGEISFSDLMSTGQLKSEIGWPSQNKSGLLCVFRKDITPHGLFQIDCLILEYINIVVTHWATETLILLA